MGKMRLVRPPASGASVSSNVSIPNPSCNQNRWRDPDLNPVSYAVTIPNPNYTRFAIHTGRMCSVHWKTHPFWNRMRIGRSRSSNVVDFGTNRKGVCDFLLVINSNFGPILHRFWDTATYWLKIAIFCTPLSFNALARSEPFRISGWTFHAEN